MFCKGISLKTTSLLRTQNILIHSKSPKTVASSLHICKRPYFQRGIHFRNDQKKISPHKTYHLGKTEVLNNSPFSQTPQKRSSKFLASLLFPDVCNWEEFEENAKPALMTIFEIAGEVLLKEDSTSESQEATEKAAEENNFNPEEELKKFLEMLQANYKSNKNLNFDEETFKKIEEEFGNKENNDKESQNKDRIKQNYHKLKLALRDMAGKKALHQLCLFSHSLLKKVLKLKPTSIKIRDVSITPSEDDNDLKIFLYVTTIHKFEGNSGSTLEFECRWISKVSKPKWILSSIKTVYPVFD